MPTNAPLPDYTPEEKARILAEMLKKFPVEEDMSDLEETYLVEQVLAEAEAMVKSKRG